MKSLVLSLTALGLLLTTGCNEKSTAKKVDVTNDVQKFSYALGLEIGGSLKKLETEMDLNAFNQGINDTLNGGITLLTEEEALEIKKSVFTKMQEEKSAKASKESGEFLATNKDKPGVTVTASGLQYEVLTKGEGPIPTAEARVKVHYTGTLTDGTEFDSSVKRGEPAEFAVNGVIPGWTEALLLMNTGTKLRVVIPSDLGYGERGAGGKIPPNATLIFEMELLEILK